MRGFVAIALMAAFVSFALYILKPIRKLLLLVFLGGQGVLMVALMHKLPYVTATTIRHVSPLISRIEIWLAKTEYGHFYSDMIDAIIRSIRLDKNLLTNEFYMFFWLSITLVVGFIVSDFVSKQRSWLYLLIPGLYFALGWFFYASELEFNFAIYLIAVFTYRQYLVYEGLPLEENKYYSRALMTNMAVLVIALSLGGYFVRVLPIVRVNATIDDLVPSVSGIRTEFESTPNKGSKSNSEYGEREVFSLAASVYAPNGNVLGGAILEQNFDDLMKVKSDVGGVYLRGTVKNIYDGKQWLSTLASSHQRTKMDLLDDQDLLNNLEEVTIYPNQIITKTIFSPLKFVTSSIEDDYLYENQAGIVLVAKSYEGDYQPYTVYYTEDHVDLLSEEERQAYLNLPDTGLDNTRIIAKQVSDKGETDHEKMQHLVNYLRLNYRYELEPEDHDPDEDFVEAFLTDGQVGYCTYFATSLAVMGRTIGIPTRYVEGFLSDYKMDEDGLYNISGDRAHAWVEAYIEGKGWVTLEATPAYYEPLGSLVVEIEFENSGSDDTDFLDDFDLVDETSEEDENPTFPDHINQPDDTYIENDYSNVYVEETFNHLYWILPSTVFIVLLACLLYLKKQQTSSKRVYRLISRMHRLSRKYRYEDNSDWPRTSIEYFMDQGLNMTLSQDERLVIDRNLYSENESTYEDLEIMMGLYRRFSREVFRFKGIRGFLRLKLRP